MDNDQYKNAIGKNTKHFDSFIESVENVKAGLEKTHKASEFASWQVLLNNAMDKFVRRHTLYFNQRYYVDLEGNDEDLAEVLGIELPKKGEEKDGKDSK